jgi:uncharacterized membrane protein
MVRTFGDYFVLIFSIVGSLASIIAFGVYFEPLLNLQGWIGVLFLGIISLFFLSYNLYLISKYRKRVKYANVFQEINIAFSQLHSIDRKETISAELIIQNLTFLCEFISHAFKKINDCEIGVCIKYLTYENKRPKAETLVRDSNSKVNGRKTGKNDTKNHWLDSNSDFDFIYSNFDNENIDTTFYYERCLPTKKGYINTRLDKNWVKENKIPFIENYLRKKAWPLWYRSTLVVPIVPINADEQSQQMIRGFLCIDAPKSNTFYPQFDVNILKGISDGLYNKIDKLHFLIQESNEPSKS